MNFRLSLAAYLTSLLGLAAAIAGTIYAYGALQAAQQQANVALNTMRLTTRPWLTVSDYQLQSITSGLRVDGVDRFGMRGRLVIDRVLTIRNVGNTPASNVFVWGVIHINPADFSAYNPHLEEKEACHETDRIMVESKEHVGSTVFPNVDIRSSLEDFLPAGDLNKSLSSGPFYGLHVAYCIRYEYASFTGHTAFEAVFQRKMGEGPIMVDGQVLNHDHFVGMKPDQSLGFAD